MRPAKTAFMLIATTALVGCTTYPQSEDWLIRDPTASIVAKARCETKFALIGELVRVLRRENSIIDLTRATPPGSKYAPIDLDTMLEEHESHEALERVINRLHSDFIVEDGSEDADPDKTERARKALLKFDQTAVTYSFDMTAQETNNNTLDFEFAVPFTNGSLSLGLIGGHVLDRKNERQFKLQDAFFQLAQLDCSKMLAGTSARQVVAVGESAALPNTESAYYPMTGRIGLERIVKFYVSAILDNPGYYFDREAVEAMTKKPLGRGTTTDVTDTVIFTTTLIGEIKPTLTFESGTRGLDLTSASLVAKPQRIDTHKLIVGFEAGKAKKKLLFSTVSSDESLAIIQLAEHAKFRQVVEGEKTLFIITQDATKPAKVDKGEAMMMGPSEETLERGLQRIRALEAIPFLQKRLDENF